jgi:glutamate:GABA antiporter
MQVTQHTDKLERQYNLTDLQRALGEPLRSEQRTGELLPRVLSAADMLAIFIVIVLFIPNTSIVQATQGAGSDTYLYWAIGTITFLVPGALISAQLYRFMPVDGGIYVWTHRALGPLWGFFAGFCAWFPGVLVLLAAADAIISLIQGIGIQIAGPHTQWLVDPWQEGIVAIAVILLGGWLSVLPLHSVMKISKWVVLLYVLSIFTVGLAGFVYLAQGHLAQNPLIEKPPSFATPHLVLYGVIVLALLGVEVPFNMAAETTSPGAPTLFLRWGSLLVLLAYLLGTFGIMVVVPPGDAGSAYSTLTAVRIVFGAPAAIGIGAILIAFFMIVIVIYNATFARLLFVSGLDHRLPPRLAQVNRHRAPFWAIALQTSLVIILALFTFILGPFLYPDQGINFTSRIYDISQATTSVIWCISMIILFLDLPILLYRFRQMLAKKPKLLIAPLWLLYLSAIVGGIASMLGIWVTLTASWDSTLIPDSQWGPYVGVATLICLIVGLIGSAYPRLLSNLNQQTAAAQENARLYQELSIAYDKLSELDQLKDAFLTTASHELRTPLTIVQGYLELLNEMNDVDAKTRKMFLNKARRACDELVLLQANIMDASRINFDAAALHCTFLSLKEICTSLADLFEPLILQEQRQVEIDVASSIMVWADETRLKQVIRNLFANALRYSPRSTPLRITAHLEPEQHMVHVNVIDRGLGVPLDKQEAIFERFVRLERDMHGSIRGSGLGLAITRQLVEAMHGTIHVESSGIAGEGSTFTFTLPITSTS